MSWRWSTSAFRWVELSFSLPSSIFRWPEFDFSYFTPSRAPQSPRWSGFNFSPRWTPQSFRLPELDFSIVDNVLWTFITAFESVALVSMLCFFFVFCGCTL